MADRAGEDHTKSLLSKLTPYVVAAALAVAITVASLSLTRSAASPGARPRQPRQQPGHLALTGSTRAPAAPVRHASARRREHTPRDALSLSRLAGERVVYAYAGLQPPASLMAAIRTGEAAGVIFFSDNIADPVQLAGVIRAMQDASLASPLHRPLLTMLDQEGGELRRLPGPPYLSEKEIGQRAGAVPLAYEAGRSAAQNLRGAGVNVNLSPVLDVYRTPNNFIDSYQRSYSSDPGVVAALGAAFVSGQQLAGVAATAKHFPGLGVASQDANTDLRPVVLDIPLDTLRSVDEAPYRAAIASRVKLVMVSWATYPALDPTLPAGLSPAIIQGELRGRLGFRGVTITDEIGAGALAPFGDLANRSVAAADAGDDLILCAAEQPDLDTPQDGLTAVRAIARALATGRLSLTAAQQAAQRVLALRGTV